MLEEVKNNFGAWWIPGRIIECRQRLKPFLGKNCPRDPLMIDVALDNIYKTSVERIDLRGLSGKDMSALISLTLQNIHLSYENEKIASCIDLWERLKNDPDQDQSSPEWGLKAFAALTYIQSMIHSYTDELYESIQPKARLIGESCQIPESYLTNFTEEVIRSQNTYILSKLLDALLPLIRKTAGIGPWKIVSHGQGRATGKVKYSDSLPSIQGRSSEKPHIMVVDKINGMEDIPAWVSAIITTSDVDILSHIAIRCRNSRVILSTCYELDIFEKLKSYGGKTFAVAIENEEIRYHEDAMDVTERITELA